MIEMSGFNQSSCPPSIRHLAEKAHTTTISWCSLALATAPLTVQRVVFHCARRHFGSVDQVCTNAASSRLVRSMDEGTPTTHDSKRRDLVIAPPADGLLEWTISSIPCG